MCPEMIDYQPLYELLTERGAEHWSGYIWVPVKTVSDMLALLPSVQPLYLEIHQLKEGRNCHIAGLTLRTTNPAET